MFAVEAALRQAGHQVAPFALAYQRNRPTDAAGHFPQPPVDGEFVLHGDRRLTVGEKLRLAGRVIRDPAVYGATRRVLASENIDVVYTLQIAHFLYPEVLLAARDAGVPVVMRLSDYQLVCPAYNCLRGGKPCFDCRSGLLPALLHRCLKGSLAVTGARVAAMTFATWRRAHDAVRAFVSPSVHLIEILRSAGYPPDRLVHLPTPLTPPPDPGPPPAEGHLLFVGGLYEAKGAALAVDAVAGTGRRLVIAGDAQTPYGQALRERVARDGLDNVEFAGFVDGAQLAALYAGALAVIVPSLWWENVPQVALEAMAYRRPVLAAGHGSLPETVSDGGTGLLFAPGDAADLRRVIDKLAADGNADELGRAGRARIAAEHDPATHLRRLQTILDGATA